MSFVKSIKNCRACKSSKLKLVCSLGPHPNANWYLAKNQIDKEELYFPLDVIFCKNCFYLQLGHEILPAELFREYFYVSSTSSVFVSHFVKYAKTIFDRFNLNENSLVVDIGSNDGVLLENFQKLNTKVLGIEPVDKIAQVSKDKGIKTLTKFFSPKLAKEILKNEGKAKIISANNTFAQISDLDGLLKGVRTLLSDEGVFVIEVPYLVDMLGKGYFDLIYHEHHSFPAIKPLTVLFKRFGMKIFDVEKQNVHGGTIRVYVEKQNNSYKIDKNVKKFIEYENKIKINKIDTYIDFFDKVYKNRIELLALLEKIKKQKKRIVGYGAPAKANTLLNFYNIGKETLDYIVDDSYWKQNMFTPGKRIPIVSRKILNKDKVDFVLILAWNFAKEIIRANKNIRKKGTKFILPFPRPKIV